MIKFRDLAIGDTFDFIREEVGRTTFWERCIKTGKRTYTTMADAPLTHADPIRVGTINVEVFHVEKAE